MQLKGKLYIIPLPISEDSIEKVSPPFNASVIKSLRFFVVERVKTARRFLRAVDRDFPIDDSVFYELDKHQDYSLNPEAIEHLRSGNNVGLMSEAGYPAIADPGFKVVAKAQEIGCQVVPLVGASSLLMALSASGLNGEGFTFNSYIDQKEPQRSKELRQSLEQLKRTKYTQIFIETPYRNDKFFEDVLKQADQEMKLCVASGITGDNEKIITRSISDWKKQNVKLEKEPTVFLIGY